MRPTPQIPVPPLRREPAPDDLPTTIRVPIPPPTMNVRGGEPTPPPRNRLRVVRPAEVVAVAKDLPAMPALGDELFGFTLVEVLGEGSFGRVYLATQSALAGRQVALKVTHRPTREPQKLARLHHTNVVPVYSVFEADRLQVICMPFVGRRTLADLMRAYRRDHPSRRFPGRRSGGTLKAGSTTLHGGSGLARSGAAVAPTGPASGDPVPLVRDVPTALKALSGLAAGLAHAHDRGLLHLDIKLANVLFADSGELMLLDFGLAHDRTSGRRDEVGGTIQYMAPEQLDDIRTSGNGAVDARTDLYSLGVLAYELLTGEVPFPLDGLLSSFDDMMAARLKPLVPASRVNPAVTPAVDAILAKLLAAEPADRYPTAGDLCEDLRRQLGDEPLACAPNTSLAERAAKWRRRHPGAVWKAVTAATVALALGTVVALDNQATARAAADAAVQFRDSRSGLGVLRLDLILGDDPRAAARGHDSAAAFLKAYGLPDDADWRKRPSFARLSADAQAQVAHDLGEVLLLQAHAVWRAAKQLPDGDGRRDAAAEALKLNQLAEGCFPADAVPPFARAQRTELLAAPGEPVGVVLQKPRTPREFFLAAVSDFAAARYTAAALRLEQAVAGQPDHAAAQMLLAVCRHHQGQYGGAAERYDAARVLIPTDPRPFFYRGVALATAGKPALAAADFTKALDLDPEYREAYRNRALAHRAAGRLEDAERDLTRGLALDGPAFQFHQMRARVRAERKDDAGAAADMKAIAELTPDRDQDFLVRAWARLEKHPDDALADYREAEKRNPRSAAALLGQVKVLADVRKKHAEGLEVAERLKVRLPDFAPAFATRAVLLARLGRAKEAKEEAERARALSDEASITYRRACVYALTGGAGDTAEAMKFLRKAFRDGYRNTAEFATDPDLDALRGTPEFTDFLKAACDVSR